ncbi:MAG: flagellar hook-associated protein FlgK [Deltaproteobacteria bacterium]|nr:flagellar hook-associated protein FlgK [Deltaproteobacteria bacterium]
MGLTSILGTSARALNAYSGALSVIGNNVANAANENYSRQRVEFSTLSPDNLGGIEIGRGLYLSNVSQVIDTFVENRLTESYQDESKSAALFEFLRSVDSIFSEFSGSGLNAAMADFFDSWTGLAAEPANITVRNEVIASAQSMINVFNQYAEAVNTMVSTIDDEIESTVPLVNNALAQIRDLNETIQLSTTSSLNYLDERRAAVNELAQYIDITVVEVDDALQIYTKAGQPLLNGENVATIGAQPNNTTGYMDITYTMGSTTATITDSIMGGRLAGLVDARDNYVASYLTELNRAAYAMVKQINTLHSGAGTAFDLDGNAGGAFFEDILLADIGSAAENISLSANVNGDPRNIVASSTAAGVPGNNVTALAIAALSSSTSIDFDPGAGTDTNSFTGHFGDLLADIGSDTLIAESTQEFHENILNQVLLERSETSGVNMDEEEINLIKFQSAYQAAARLVQVADTLLASLMEILG